MKFNNLKNSLQKKNYIYLQRKTTKKTGVYNKPPTRLFSFRFPKGKKLQELVKYFIDECKQRQEQDKQDKRNYITQEEFFNLNKK